MFEAVLFDLDGTLADTAPDLGGALNRLRIERGMPAVPMEKLRPYTSQGVRGLLGAGMNVAPDHQDYQALSTRLLELYEANICVDTRLFDGMTALLEQLEAKQIRWGIVTNKRARYTQPLMAALGLTARAATIVSGDTTPESKPSPLPILHACREAGSQPSRTLYVGDDKRDIEAGKAAGTGTVAVRFGYLGDGGPIESWQADYIADDASALAAYIFQQGT